MYPIIENMSASQTAELTKAPDCPHDHVKDTGINRLRTIVREETDDGRKIVRFLTRAMDGEIPGFEPHHELEAAKILSNLGSDEAAEFVRSYGQRRRKRATPKGEPTSAKKLASDFGQSDPYLVLEPEISDIARFIRQETSGGKTIVRRLIQIMETQDDSHKPHHNLASAKELLNRGWTMPNAVECSWHCTHHVPAEYFNGQKSKNPVLSLPKGDNPSKKEADTTPSTAQDTENADSAPSDAEADTTQPAVAVEESPDESAQDSPKTGFTDIDSLPDPFWMSVLDLCERLEEKGRIPPLPLGPDDPLPDIGAVKIVDFPEVDLTDDDVAARFWARVGEQIEIQEDWGELSRYSPKRPEPTIWEMVMDQIRRESLPPPDSS